MSPPAMGQKTKPAGQGRKTMPPTGGRVMDAGFVAMSGAVCWAKQDTKAFVKAVVREVYDKGVKVKSAEADMDEEWVCNLQDLLPRSEGRSCVANMDDLPELNMAEVLANVEELYCRSQPPRPGSGWCAIYSSVGPVLIAMNPFKQLPLYGEDWVQAFRKAGSTGSIELVWRTMGPHCYGTVEQAFQGLRKQVHQSVVICGESGAGKTETNRMMLEYLLDAETYNPKDSAPESETLALAGPGAAPLTASSKAVLKRMISEANSLQEAFGNAKTVRNDNSSRFGKYSQLHFDGKSYGVRGFEIEHYLLERSRVVSTPEGERNYHIFFQLLRSSRAAEFGLDGGPEAFQYARLGTDASKTDGSTFRDDEDFDKVMQSMELAGFTAEESTLVLETVAAVLHLGNVDFEGGRDQCRVSADSRKALQTACDLLGIPASGQEGLETGLIRMRTAQFVRNLGEQEARAQRDAVAKTVYARLFDWLVSRLNERLMLWRGGRRATVGLLDIFGFEDMPVNGFEQMLINLTNEHIQYLFNAVMFERELEAYRRDGVDAPCEQGASNLPCIELFAGPNGLVRLLADLCKAPGEDGTKDKTFVGLLNKNMKGRPHYQQVEPQDMKEIMSSRRHRWGNKVCNMEYHECFQIKHYAGEVVYTVRDFIVKSKDTLPLHLAEVLQSSRKAGFVKLLGAVEESPSKDTVAEKFVKQMQVLSRRLDQGGNLFVRCIKPNQKSIPGIVDRPMVLEQLICGGVVSALEVRRKGFPDRMEFREFCDEFWILELGWRGSTANYHDARKHCADLLKKFVGQETQYAFGHTKVFMRIGVLAHMRATVAMRTLRYAKVIQRRWRIRKGLEALHEVEEASAHLAELVQEAEERRLARHAPVARATDRAQSLLDALRSHMARVRGESGDLSPRSSDRAVGKSLFAKYSKDITKLRELVVQAREEVERAIAKRNQLEQLLAAKMQARKQEASALLVKVEALEGQCSEADDVEGLEEQVSSANACRTARERLEKLMRQDFPEVEQKQLAALSLDEEYGSDPVPQAYELLMEVSSLIDTAVVKVEELKLARCRFEEEVAPARGLLSEARERLEALSTSVLDAVDEEVDDGSLEEALAAAWQIETDASAIMRSAKDTEAFTRSVGELLGAISAVEAATLAAQKLKHERALERAREARDAQRAGETENVLSTLHAAPALFGSAASFLAALRATKQELEATDSMSLSMQQDREKLAADLTHVEELVESVLNLPSGVSDASLVSWSCFSPRAEIDRRYSKRWEDCTSCVVQ